MIEWEGREGVAIFESETNMKGAENKNTNIQKSSSSVNTFENLGDFRRIRLTSDAKVTD